MNYLSEAGSSAVLKTILDIKDKISKGINTAEKITGSNKNRSNVYLGGSLSQYSKDLIMTFPMLCDDTLSIETASMLSRANERYIISLLQMLFAAETLQGLGGSDVIRKIHKNIKSNMALDDYIDIADNIDRNIKDNFSESAEINRAQRIFTESLKNVSYKRYPTSSFSNNSLNDYKCINHYGKTLVTEDDKYPSYDKSLSDIMQANKDRDKAYNNYIQLPYGDVDTFTKDDYEQAKKDLKDRASYAQIQSLEKDRDRRFSDQRRQNSFNNQMRNKEYYLKQKEYDLKQKTLQNQIKDTNIKQLKNDLDTIANSRQQTSYELDYMKKILVDSEVKKANELQPSLMVVKYIVPNSVDPTKMVLAEKPFICGVKSRLVPVEAKDIIDRMISKNKTKISFLNFIRATTGEIGFVKDFLFSLDQAKIDSKNAVKRGPSARIWKTLEFRATKNQKNMLKKSGNDASAITTLVINQETVNFLKKQYDFNLEDLKNTRLIMDSYNLLGIIICDEALEVAKSYYAGNDSYETQAFSYLEKESNDKSYKKVISLISQMNGR